MTKIGKRFGLGAIALMGCCAMASAAVEVGDKPVFAGKAVGDGRAVTSDALNGRIVVIDFWATWCPPCVESIPHLVELNEKYGEKGLAIVGISLDQGEGVIPPFAKQHKMSWPTIMSKQANANLANEWGVRGIPNVFILNPDGVVVWKGHPGDPRFEKTLTETFEKTPPKLVDAKTLEAAGGVLDQAEKAIAAGDTVAAFKAMSGFPAEAEREASVVERLKPLREKLEAAADGLMGEVDGLVEKKDYVAAVTRLKGLSKSLPGEKGKQATAKLVQLQSDPEARKAIAIAEKEIIASAALNKATALKDAGNHPEAYKAFKSAALMKETPSGQAAADAVKAYEADKALMNQVNGKEIERKAKSLLNLAQSYKSAGKIAQAKAKFEQVIAEFPDSDYAKQAKDAMKSL